MPESLNCDLGSLRCRDNVSPIVAACFNENIPLRIIEFLLQKGANPNFTYLVSWEKKTFLEDIAFWKNQQSEEEVERFKAIENLFKAYDK